MSTGKLFLIPTYLSDTNDPSFIAPMVIEIIKKCRYYLVENVRTTRRFISSLKADIVIDDLSFHVLDKRSSWDDLYPILEPIRSGYDMAVMSEAGVPCLADPGNLAVTLAHQTHIRVVPLPGASSIQMALIASGFNGQQFTFHGYLPIEQAERRKKIKELEREASSGYTQIFMETPYRNHQLLEDIIRFCKPDTLLSIASDISGAKEGVATKSVSAWKKTTFDIHKIPAIFSFGLFP